MKNPKPIGFLSEKASPETEQNIPSILSPLDIAINKLCQHYQPVDNPIDCDGNFITTDDIYTQLQQLYPSKKYYKDTIVELLMAHEWTVFYHSTLHQYFWQVKLIS